MKTKSQKIIIHERTLFEKHDYHNPEIKRVACRKGSLLRRLSLKAIDEKKAFDKLG